jgi:predicted GNAT family acetyltransferase
MEPETTPEMDALLSNPYWSALCTEQAALGLGGPLAKRFPAEVIPFAGVADGSAEALEALRTLLAPEESLYVTSDVPYVHPGLVQELEFAGLQMIYPATSLPPSEDETVPIEALSKEHIPEMIALKAIAFPGYFGPRAAGLGNFFGIRVEGSLVAMAGERLMLPGMCEISAVCTHPEHLGKGYAAALIRGLLRAHRTAGKRSFLQAAERNTRAVGLYERLGFVRTRGLIWRKLKRVDR